MKFDTNAKGNAIGIAGLDKVNECGVAEFILLQWRLAVIAR